MLVLDSELLRGQRSMVSTDLSRPSMLALLIVTRPISGEHYADPKPSEVSLNLEYHC